MAFSLIIYPIYELLYILSKKYRQINQNVIKYYIIKLIGRKKGNAPEEYKQRQSYCNT